MLAPSRRIGCPDRFVTPKLAVVRRPGVNSPSGQTGNGRRLGWLRSGGGSLLTREDRPSAPTPRGRATQAEPNGSENKSKGVAWPFSVPSRTFFDRVKPGYDAKTRKVKNKILYSDPLLRSRSFLVANFADPR